MLTERQRRVYEFTLKSISSRGYPPTLREIGTALGISSLRGVTCHLDALEKKGYIKREPTPRGISITRVQDVYAFEQEDLIRAPLLGRIPAGTPNAVEECAEGEVAVPIYLLGSVKGRVFLLRVTGDSMIGDHILDGDLVVVEVQQEVRNGDVVVANVEGESTVKRIFMEKNQVRLKASNPVHKDILVSRNFRIAGKVIGLLRRLDRGGKHV